MTARAGAARAGARGRAGAGAAAARGAARRAGAARGPAPARAAGERTYVMVKPDGVQRGLVGDVISRFERKGFALKGLKLFQTPQELAEEHYKDLSERPFFPDLVGYICSGPVVCMVWEGTDAVSAARKIIGGTNPAEAEAGTIRGDLAVEVGRNVVHGSDSVENGQREISLWFDKDCSGLAEWTPTITPWVVEEGRN